MSEPRCCDICGRSESELPPQTVNSEPELQIDADGLWACSVCRAKLVTKAEGEMDSAILPAEIKALVGKSAGAICYVLNLPYEPPYDSIVEAASKIAYDEDQYMSAWSFVTQWIDGTTVWRDQDGSSTAIVSIDGTVRIDVR